MGKLVCGVVVLLHTHVPWWYKI